MRIISVRAEPWTLPLVAPFAIARRTALEARNVRITIETDDARITGYGESAPVGYVTGESVETVIAAIGAVAAEFAGRPLDRLGPLWERVGSHLSEARAARAGLEMALCDAWGKHWGMPLWQFFGGARETLISDLTIPLVTPEEAGALAAAAVEDGFRHLKIKVGDSKGHEADLARIEQIVRAAPGVSLRIDANQAFSPEEAVSFATSVLSLGSVVEMLEQPVPKEDVKGLKYVKERVPIPVFADEAARDVSEVLHLLREDAVDGVNVKLMKSGLSGALQIIALCRAAGKKLMLGCMLESPLGIAAAAQIAGGTGAFDFLDLDSHRLLAPTPTLTGGYVSEGDALHLGETGSGWGVSIHE